MKSIMKIAIKHDATTENATESLQQELMDCIIECVLDDFGENAWGEYDGPFVFDPVIEPSKVNDTNPGEMFLTLMFDTDADTAVEESELMEQISDHVIAAVLDAYEDDAWGGYEGPYVTEIVL